jgi:SOS-response transcriptional repressor LexA
MARNPVYGWDNSPLALTQLSGASLALLDAIQARPRGVIREWQADLRWSTTSMIEHHLHRLRRAGLLTWTPGKARSVVLLDGVAGETCERCVALERVLRRIARDVTPANAYPECVERVHALVMEALGDHGRG